MRLRAMVAQHIYDICLIFRWTQFIESAQALGTRVDNHSFHFFHWKTLISKNCVRFSSNYWVFFLCCQYGIHLRITPTCWCEEDIHYPWLLGYSIEIVFGQFLRDPSQYYGIHDHLFLCNKYRFISTHFLNNIGCVLDNRGTLKMSYWLSIHLLLQRHRSEESAALDQKWMCQVMPLL